VDPRVRWQTLQAHLSAARFALKMGDRARAHQEVETALSIDPDFLAARLLRDQLNTSETSTVLPAPEVFQAPSSAPVPKTSPTPASLAASSAKLAQFEEKVRQRLEARGSEPGPRELEVEEIPTLSEPPAPSREPRKMSREPRVTSPEPRVASSPKRSRSYSLGAVAAAAAVFALAVASSSRVQEPRLLYSHATIATAPLIDAMLPLPLERFDAVEVPAPTPIQRSRPLQEEARPVPVRVALTTPSPFVPPQNLPAASRTAPSAPPASFGVAQAAPSANRPVAVVSTPLPIQATPVSSVVTDSPPPAVIPRLVDDRALVEETLGRYRRAYNLLDAQSAQAVYPAINAPALARAFDGLQSQSLQFDECDIDVRGALARATCRGSSRYVPKVGSRDPQVEPRVWDFTLRKDDGDWKIENARAGR
jgi:hypothetical protein